ncbi:TPA: hypothetical protein N0F65_000654 [Lagenidium giganteum]|uniref:AB hydrolase-1 domain-containing protein n=1 Tax=Lagenidium giganteum TaxID=4803 RepID=A0AAV2YPH4_9STRA|nr:TPA: hypothetical protein N0F65_000654 [Lagenidium giganteum]
MVRASSILVVAASSAFIAGTRAQPFCQDQDSTSWTPCNASLPIPGASEFECAEVTAPLCHKGVCESKQTIKLFVKRLRATQDADNKPNVWLLAGGPGQAGTSLFDQDAATLRDMSEQGANFYMTDHRGTGRSAPLDCGKKLQPSGYGECFRKLLAQSDNKPEAFSVTSAANDVVHLATKFATNAETYVYGVSYGTYLTERVIHLAPKIVKGYMLDGVSADRNNPFTYTSDDMMPVTKRLAEACEGNDFCRSKFEQDITKHGSLYTAFVEIVNSFDKSSNQCVDWIMKVQKEESADSEGAANATTSPSKAVRRLLGGFILGDQKIFIPAYLYRIKRCNDNDMQFVQAFTKSEDDDIGIAQLLYNVISIRHLYNSTPAFTYKPDQYNEKVAPIPDGVGVIVFNGGLDFNTPWEYGRRQFDDMKTSNKLMVEAEHGPHGIALSPITPEDESQCGHQIFLQFVASKGDVSKVDASCMKHAPLLQYDNEQTVARVFKQRLGGDAFDGTVLPDTTQEPKI